MDLYVWLFCFNFKGTLNAKLRLVVSGSPFIILAHLTSACDITKSLLVFYIAVLRRRVLVMKLGSTNQEGK